MKSQIKKFSIAAMTVAISAMTFWSCGSDDPEPVVTPEPGTPETVAVTSVTLNKTTLALKVGASETLTATVAPSNATNKTVSWASSNTNVATVNNGAITAVAEGTANITVTTADGAKTATCALTVNPIEYDVYAAGMVAVTQGEAAYVAGMYWKNGQATTLTSYSNGLTIATDIAVDGNDIYACGTTTSGGDIVAVYWKNNFIEMFDIAGNSAAAAIKVYGNDVYACGYDTDTDQLAIYWKNGVANYLPSAGPTAVANDIVVSGTDVYVCGQEYSTTTNKRFAKLWKNGTGIAITGGSTNAEATGIAVIGSTVYMVGWEEDSNGRPIAKSWAYTSSGITTRTYGNDAKLTCIAIADNNIIVGGDAIVRNSNTGAQLGTKVFYCKGNSELQVPLTTGYSACADIKYVNGDIYIAGYATINGKTIPTYWKNETEITLNSQYEGQLSSILVVEKP
jgi:hypothetical protein